jgi:hypothetical protein
MGARSSLRLAQRMASEMQTPTREVGLGIFEDFCEKV